MAGALERARFLYQQGRHDEAIDVLGAHLAEAPSDEGSDVRDIWLLRCPRRTGSLGPHAGQDRLREGASRRDCTASAVRPRPRST